MKPAPFQNIEVLIVDDETMLRETTARNIATLGYVASTADSAEKALRHLSAQQANVVVSDIRMGRMDGLTMGKELRRSDPNLAIIFVTGKPEKKGVASAQNMRAIQYMQKPFNFAELAENLSIAARWNIAQLIGAVAEKYIFLRGGRMGILTNKLQIVKAEIKRFLSNAGDGAALKEMAYSKTPQSSKLCAALDEKMAPLMRTINM